MSAILSADDLNDFITPGVACIKPVETLPSQQASKPDVRSPFQIYPASNEELLIYNLGQPV